MRKILLVTAIAVIISAKTGAQEEKPFMVKGYLTSLQSAVFDSVSGPVLFENLLHNRINLRYDAGSRFSFAAEFRNRLFTGDMVRSDAAYADRMGSDNGFLDLSWNIFSENSFLLNTTVDRIWASYKSEKFQVTAGRQRINWGQTFVWNPNDIFNSYSFFDFDYTERPGSDAVRLEYFPSFSSAAELAVKYDSDDNITAAGLWRFNTRGYDIQFLAGYANGEDIVFGTGWSGSVGKNSFRGEVTGFFPSADSSKGNNTVIATMGLDRVFGENSNVQVQFMYCNNPISLSDFGSFYSGNRSAKSLAFSRFTAFGQYTHALTPLASAGVSAMWFPDIKGWFAGPSFDFSLSDNTAFSLLWQHFRGNPGGDRMRMNLGFLRIKYSF
jgi:hypothetical protein